MKRILMLLALFALLYAVSQAPGPWADTVQAAGAKAGEIATGFGTFFTNLATS